MDFDTEGIVKLWIAMLLIALFICSIIFYIRLIVENKTLKNVLRLLILVIIGFPISLILFSIYNSISFHLSMNHDEKLYFLVINILGIFGYIIYRIVLHILNKSNKKSIYSFMLDVNIIFNLFILISCIIKLVLSGSW
jgi:hypothetical protein